MTPGARIQAAIELLDQVLISWKSDKRFPADKQLDFYFKSHRYIGSKERGAISEMVYGVLRHKAALEWHVNFPPPERGRIEEGVASPIIDKSILRNQDPHPPLPLSGGGRMMILAALILRGDHTARSIHGITQDGSYATSPLTAEERTLCTRLEGQNIEHPDMPPHVRFNYPEWTHAMLTQSFGGKIEEGMRAMNAQAPTDLRVNTLKTTREELLHHLKDEGFNVAPAPLSPVGIRLPRRAPVFTSRWFKEGHFEVQDEGSQIVAGLVDAEPGMKVVDFCAGAGGKTLALAAAMRNKGRILAWDISGKRLSQMKERLRRAGVDNVQAHVIENENDQFIKRHKGEADRVLVDAPCSGSGTWRRNPDLKWRFTEKDLREVTAVQQSILQSAARVVKIGGRLIYVTCSVFSCENEHQIEQFLKDINNFKVVCAKKIWDKALSDSGNSDVSYLWITPHQDGADGFFAAVLERTV